MQEIYDSNISDVDFSQLNLSGNVLLVTGKKSYINCGASEILRKKLKNCNVTHYNDFETNPRLEDVRKGIKLLGDAKTIIAVGGGSVMDMAKLIKGLSNQEYNPEKYITGKQTLKEREDINLIAIPTTSGSGSESTHFAVVYIDKTKYSLAHQSLLPDTVVLDYRLTKSMSSYQTACSGLDALSQSIESFWSVNSNEESLSYSRKSISIIINNLISAVNNPNEDNKTAMQQASNLAGKAINITKTTAPHAFSYYLTSHFDIPHGYAASLLLGKFILFNSRVSANDLSDNSASPESVIERIQELCRILGVEDPEKAYLKISQIISECGLVSDLSEMIDLDQHFDDIYDSVNRERLKNNPRLIKDKREIYTLFMTKA